MEAQRGRKPGLKLAVSVGSPRPHPSHNRRPHVTHHAGPVAAAALVAPSTMAFVALLKVKLPLNCFPGTSRWFHSPSPDPMMSPSQTEVQRSRARVERWPSHETGTPKGLECQAQEVVPRFLRAPAQSGPDAKKGTHKTQHPSPS